MIQEIQDAYWSSLESHIGFKQSFHLLHISQQSTIIFTNNMLKVHISQNVWVQNNWVC